MLFLVSVSFTVLLNRLFCTKENYLELTLFSEDLVFELKKFLELLGIISNLQSFGRTVVGYFAYFTPYCVSLSPTLEILLKTLKLTRNEMST